MTGSEQFWVLVGLLLWVGFIAFLAKQYFALFPKNAPDPLNGWQLTCYALAVPIVYLAWPVFIEGTAYLIGQIAFLKGFGALRAIMGGIQKILLPEDYIQMPSDPTFGELIVSVITNIIGLVIRVILYIPFGILGFLLGMTLLILFGLPADALEQCIIHVDTPLRFIPAALFVWFVGAFLYGVFSPLLWAVVSPILAATAGEVVYQRARARLYGADVARLRKPLYLTLAVASLLIGFGRFSAPPARDVAENLQESWIENISAVFTPPPWPARIQVGPREVVETGRWIEPDHELRLWTDEDVFFRPSEGERYLLKPKADRFSRNTCIAGLLWERCRFYVWGWAEKSQIVLEGGAHAATVTIQEPVQARAHWFKQGETQRTTTQANPGDELYWCSGGKMQYRLVSGAGATEWRDVHPQYCNRRKKVHIGPGRATGPRIGTTIEGKHGGFLEVRSAGPHTWFLYEGISRRNRK